MSSEDQISNVINAENCQEMSTNDEKRDEVFDYSSSYIIDCSVLLNEIRRIENTSRAISRTLAAMTKYNDDQEILSKASDLCNDIEENEKNLFSPIPDYVAQIIDAEKERRLKMSDKVQPLAQSRQSNTSIPPRPSAGCRAYVDPRIPLPLPYDVRRDHKARLAKNQAVGTYHNLFYGDGSEYVFTPPKDNKRIQLEQEKNSKPVPSKSKPRKYEPPVRKPMKVAKDFVPSCAYAKKTYEQKESM